MGYHHESQPIEPYRKRKKAPYWAYGAFFTSVIVLTIQRRWSRDGAF